MKLHLECNADEAMNIIKSSTQGTGLFKTYYTIDGEFDGHTFKLGIIAPKQLHPYAHIIGTVTPEGEHSLLLARFINRKLMKIPKPLLVLAAITFFCGSPYLAYSVLTLGEGFGVMFGVVLVSLCLVLAGLSQHMGSYQQEELEGFLPKIFSGRIKQQAS